MVLPREGFLSDALPAVGPRVVSLGDGEGQAVFGECADLGNPGSSCPGNAGLPQSCRFPKSLAPDCRNPAVFRRVWLRIAAILPFPEEFGSGLPQSCRFPKSLAPDCCNPAVSRRVWLRIAAILPFSEEFGSGLLQSCRFPKSLAPDCRNPAVFRRVWLRIAAILPFPEEFGSGLPQSCRFQPGTAWISGNPRKNLPEMAGALRKSLTFRLPTGRVCRLSIS